jgi:hypothetical protein
VIVSVVPDVNVYVQALVLTGGLSVAIEPQKAGAVSGEGSIPVTWIEPKEPPYVAVIESTSVATFGASVGAGGGVGASVGVGVGIGDGVGAE